MALFISETAGVIEVREELYTFTQTRYSWSYYNLATRMQSMHCKQNSPLDRKMDQATFDWVTKHYVPKIEQYKPMMSERLAEVC